jgi:hypothetical protein
MATMGLQLAVAALALVAGDRALADVEVDRFSGVARGRDGAVRYLEEHEVRRDGERVLDAVTTYRAPTAG